MKSVKNIYCDLVSIENVFAAWREFRRGKGGRSDVLAFERDLEDNLFALRDELASGAYQHGAYRTFHIRDPKPREINKASVRDRVVHHLVYAKLYDLYDRGFINNSYSSRVGKGTHLAVDDIGRALKTASRNYTKGVFALKGDVKKFFDSIDHAVLLDILKRKVKDDAFLRLLEKIIKSFGCGRGLPLGNVTSQVLANIYLNEMDQFVKQVLKMKHYFRYADDFVVLNENRNRLKDVQAAIGGFLNNKLALRFHDDKTFIIKSIRGVDFCGYVTLPHYRVLRTITKRRMFKKSAKKFLDYIRGRVDGLTAQAGVATAQSLSSYFGILQHCQSRGIANELLRGDHF